MNTIKISVKSNKNAKLLISLLKSLKFVTNVEQISDSKSIKKEKQFEKLNQLLNKLGNSNLFSEIADPIQWQKNLRNEWK